MKKHFVHFFSPGTFVAEETTKEVDSWSIEKAIQMAREIKERHGATPYGFQFSTRERTDKDFNSREVDRTGTFWLGGEVFSLEEIKALNKPEDRILISNMESNGWDKVVVNNNSYSWTQPLEPRDKVLDFDAKVPS